MKQNAKDDKTLRAYLLGDLAEPEQEEMDGWLLANDDAYDLLVAAEDDLIDDSLNGNLTAHELERLNNYFLVSEEHQRKLQFSQSFRNFVNSASRTNTATSFWDSVTAFFRLQAPLAYSASAVLVLMLAGNVWLVFRTVNLQQELGDAVQQRAELGRQLGEQQVNLRSFVLAFAAAPELQTMPPMKLSPLTLRSASNIREIEIAPDAHVVKFALELLEDGHYDSYSAVLSGANDQALFTADKLPATTAPENKAVIFPVPADTLKAGEYRIKLSGIASSHAEDVSSFKFLAVRK